MEQKPVGSLIQQPAELNHEQTLMWIDKHRAWRRARKAKPIWARQVRAEEMGKPFQTADRAVEKAQAGYWLCVGVAGEPWFQPLQTIEVKYDHGGLESKRFTFDSEPRDYLIFQPKAGVFNWAAQVTGPGIDGFAIRPNYDAEHPLHSPAGGYVVKPDVEDPYHAKPDDVWLVQQGLFESTYELLDADISK